MCLDPPGSCSQIIDTQQTKREGRRRKNKKHINRSSQIDTRYIKILWKIRGRLTTVKSTNNTIKQKNYNIYIIYKIIH